MGRSSDAIELLTLEGADGFNSRRLPEPIDKVPPANAEERYYAMQEVPPMAT